MVRITTWNVNGIRNPLGYKPWSDKRTYDAMFDILEADIVIMQELKIQRKDLRDDMVLVPGWDCYFSLPKHKKGYSGVGIYTRQSVCAPIRAEEGVLGVLCPPGSSTPYRELPEDASIGGYPTAIQVADLGVDPEALDAEGRCLVVEFPAFVLFGVYAPANSNGLRDDFRYGFHTALDTRIRNLAKMGKNVILTGDLNVSRDLIDTAKAEDNMRSEGMTYDEYLSTPNRRVFNQLLLNGKVAGERDEGREKPILYDLCREFHPDREGMYTHWEQKINARPGNFGSRIDFVLCSITIKDWFQESNIQEGLMGSDHCPVYAVTKDKVPTNGEWRPSVEGIELQEETHTSDLMNPPGMFKTGVRQREYHPTKDVPPLSGKLLPEFTRRRNIRDMFSKKPALPMPDRAVIPTNIEARRVSNVDDGVDVPSSAATNSSDKEPTPLAETISTIPSSHANGFTAPSPSQMNSPEKRHAPSVSPVKSVKRSKSNLSAAGTNAPSLAKGQQSLKGFFQSRTKPADPIPVKDTVPPASASAAANNATAAVPAPSQAEANAIPPPSPSAYVQTDPLASQEASKEGWTKLFSKKPSPRCEGHAEPCILLTTKKPGVNCGRQFWMCPRPIGPSGQKESGTQWRCGTFIWASDWKG
ncbi:DNase I-like protein [Setomelanomma holmii]|uniref:DNA-(apurinic or apyrimidinic site) endonuclease 2 n=1 Tax=Setomelanomma holmii TaxID=210430 RepID=A0A9P4HK13_9PLEO|nr:DNase I-like protein [Setomelanomma holmii]